MLLMLLMGLLLILGITVTLWWGGTSYSAWRTQPDSSDSATDAASRYLRGVAIALVGGFWAGALVTGPAVRLIMRLLAVTAGDDAQGRLTEADEVVGAVELDGTIGLWLFGGVLPGLLSAAIYVVIRRWLPAGRLGGVAFGGLHLVVAATRVDPLRPDNVDFDVVGPGWLSVVTFGLAAVLHGMAVVALANRYSSLVPPPAGGRIRAALPLALPVLLLVPGVSLLIPIVAGLLIAVVVVPLIGPAVRLLRSPTGLVVGRVALVVLVLALLPGTVSDLVDVIDR